MMTLVQTPARGIEMGVKARERALKHYSWNAVGSQMLDLYKALLGGQKPKLK
jgi:glycosyltransferase involved in cell wall biosynthesis